MGNMTQVMDLVDIEKDLGAKEMVFRVFPPLCMKHLLESFQLTFQLEIKGHPRAISIHLDLVGAVLALWSRVHLIHLCSVLGITDIATR